MRVAISQLPKNALIDTGVFLRFLGDRPDEPKSMACKAFCKAMLDNDCELFIAAPSIAEITRWRGGKLPRAKGITVVAFDERAAELLGIRGPVNTITEIMKETGETRNCVKYDFLIAACAIRAHADVLVSLDKDLPKICEPMKIPCKKPEEYEEVSLLRLASPAPSPSS